MSLTSGIACAAAERRCAAFEPSRRADVGAASQRSARKNANLRTTRDLLLPKLISGELDVSAMPEPEALAA